MLENLLARVTRRALKRRCVGVALLFTLLWTQLAVAFYACPSLMRDPGNAVAAVSGMDDCDGMRATPSAIDPDNPNLCLQHSLQGDQNADHGSSSVVVPVYGPRLIVEGTRTPPVATSRTALERRLTRSTAPPKSIAHCCFRI